MTAGPLRTLILGGTGEALALGQRLAGDGRFAATYSVAGRTRAPRLPDLPARRGGFGGAEGLAAYLRAQQIEALVDATHPFAARISANAAAASARTGTPLLALQRPAWAPGPGERWRRVADMADAAAALGEAPRRVLLTVGNQELAAFCAAPQHAYVARCLEPPRIQPPGTRCLRQRGPFRYADERALLEGHGIDALVTKNAGGEATRAKLEAARDCGVEVVMVERPALPAAAHRAADAEQAWAWLCRCQAARGG